MRSTRQNITLILAALTIGMFAASALPAQGLIDGYASLTPDQVESNDDFRRVYNSHARIRAYNNGSMAWMGSATAISRQNGRITLLTNHHVASGADRVTVEYFIDGFSQGEVESDVEFLFNDGQLDIAILTTVDKKSLAGVETIPMVEANIEVGQEMFWVGSARGEWPQGRLGHIVNVSDQFFLARPEAIGGDSGSSMVQFLDDGTPVLVGLTAWVTSFEGQQVAMSMKGIEVLKVLEQYVPAEPKEDKPEIELSPIERDGLFQGLLERLKRDRLERQLEIQGVRDMIKGGLSTQKEMKESLETLNQDGDQLENLLSQELQGQYTFEQEVKLFNGRIMEWLASLGQGLGDVEDGQESLGDKLNGSFASVKLIMGFAKLIFWGMIALLVASLFFKQGWATTVIVGTVVFFFRTTKLFIALVKNALVSKSEAPTSTQDAIDDIREGIEDGVSKP